MNGFFNTEYPIKVVPSNTPGCVEIFMSTDGQNYSFIRTDSIQKATHMFKPVHGNSRYARIGVPVTPTKEN